MREFDVRSHVTQDLGEASILRYPLCGFLLRATDLSYAELSQGQTILKIL